jgi:hypothetical protein
MGIEGSRQAARGGKGSGVVYDDHCSGWGGSALEGEKSCVVLHGIGTLRLADGDVEVPLMWRLWGMCYRECLTSIKIFRLFYWKRYRKVPRIGVYLGQPLPQRFNRRHGSTLVVKIRASDGAIRPCKGWLYRTTTPS